MKKVVLSALAATIVTSAVYAETMTLFSDPKTGQVFTTAGEGRVEMGDFIDAKSIDMSERERSSAFSEYQDKMKKYTNVSSHAKQLQFSGTHYFGLTSANVQNPTPTMADSTGFELRRNYLQVKAYFNDKDFFRVTMDTTKELGSTTTNANIYAKYAYLYLDKVLPYTGVEIGIAHRPWIDYEEHNSWYYRSFNKVLLEEKNNTYTESGVDLVNSADLGVNFKTATDSFSSEIGIFNGEGYHADKLANNQQNSKDLSLEWRLTGHILGSGEKLGKNNLRQDTYFNVSTYGLISKNHKDNNVTTNDNNQYDRAYYGLHAVYNQPEFLIAAQIVTDKDKAQYPELGTGSKEINAWSVNAEYRPIQDWTVVGRYDAYKIETVAAGTGAKTTTNDGTKVMAALAYEYNKNVKFIGSAKFNNDKVATATSKDVYMLTTEVEW